MKIEKELLQFKQDFQLSSLRLSELQTQYLTVLTNQSSIESTVVYFLNQGWLVSFKELYSLVEKLVQEKIILNANILSYFQNTPSLTSSLTSETTESIKKYDSFDKEALKKLPFFRSLDSALVDLLLQNARHIQVPIRGYVCRAGEKTREMYILLDGQAGVYRPLSGGRHQMIASLAEGSLFGEAGFFLGTQRSASIIALKKSDFLEIPYSPEIFDGHIDKNKVHALQMRFWVQHALQKSEFFKNIPTDCLDALGFSGRVVKVAADQVLFRKGDIGQTAYIVIQGSLIASQNGQNIRVLNQGALFGEISLLVSQGKRTADVQSQNECLLLEIHQNDFYRLLSQNLFLAKELEILAYERILSDSIRAQ